MNRVASGKNRGYIVDYIGLANRLQEALSIYGADDQKDIADTLQDISVELPVLEDRYRRLLNLFTDNGVAEIQGFVEQKLAGPDEDRAVLEQAVELMEDIKLRANFEVYLKKFLQSMDIVLPNAAAGPYRIPVKRFGFLLQQVKERYKDDSLSISGAGAKVRKLIDEHLISLGIDPQDSASRVALGPVRPRGREEHIAQGQGQRDGARYPQALQGPLRGRPGLLQEAQ